MVWALVLLLAAIVFILLEALLPSGGLLGFLAGCALFASLFLSFSLGIEYGAVVLALTVVSLPITIGLVVHWWPHTPLGRLILIPRPKHQDEMLPDNPEYQLASLIGRWGEARSKMRPSGRVEIGGESYDALSQGMAIEPGTLVRVIAVHTNRIVVRPVQPGETEPSQNVSGNDSSILSQPFDSIGVDPFQDPLA